MSKATTFTIGAEVVCADGSCGDLRRVVIDPVARALTHLVVEPKHRQAGGHLVPIGLVDSVADEISLKCSLAEYDALEPADETQFLHGSAGQLDYESDDVLSQPYFPLVPGPMQHPVGGIATGDMRPGTQSVRRDRVPAGEVEVRRGEHVHAKDGQVGRVRGLVVDPADGHVTHVLLDEGHLWGKKRVAIPISAVAGVDDGVRVDLTKDELRDLPDVHVAVPE